MCGYIETRKAWACARACGWFTLHGAYARVEEDKGYYSLESGVDYKGRLSQVRRFGLIAIAPFVPHTRLRISKVFLRSCHKMLEVSKGVRFLLLLLLCPATIGASEMCSDFSPDYFLFEPPFFDPRYTGLYRKFEEALLNNKTLLEELRAGFISKGNIPVNFGVKLELMNGTDVKCSDYPDRYTSFCHNVPGSPWTLCNPPIDLTFSSQTLSNLQAEEQKQNVDNSILWLSFLHGNLLSLFQIWSGGTDYNWYESDVLLTLRIGELDCNPSFNLTKCVLSELISWVSYYNIKWQ